MQKMAQGWFSQSSGTEDQLQKTTSSSSSSLLADWNSYAATRDADDGSGLAFGFDIESAVRSANDTVSGTFNVVSKGVRDLPGNLQSATSTVPSGKALMYFGLFLASGVFFIFIAFTMFLPVMVLMPQKFALCFTVGCGFIIGSFFALRGPKNQLAHMSSKERLPFTLGFIGSMAGTIYVSHSCSLDAKIKMNLEAQVVEKPAEINKKKPAERKKPTSTEPRAKRLRKKDSDSNKPKRPPTAFFLFMDDFRKEYKEAHPDSKGVTGVAKEAGEKWKNMTDEEKKPYLDKAAELKADYSKAMEGNGDDNEVEDKAENEVEDKAENEDGDECGSEKDVAEKEVQQDEENLDDY